MNAAFLALMSLLLSGQVPVREEPIHGVLFLSAVELASLSDPQVAARAGEVQRRYNRAKAMIKWPAVRGEREMLETSLRSYELALYAIGRGPTAAHEAAEFVQRLEPCYEWEGFHDCPEREALFAELALNEAGWIGLRDFLPLLAAQRWLCAAEGYERDGTAADARRSRANAARLFVLANQSDDPLVRASAIAIEQRGTCFAK